MTEALVVAAGIALAVVNEVRLRRLAERVTDVTERQDAFAAAVREALQTSADEPGDPVAAAFRRFQQSADRAMGRS